MNHPAANAPLITDLDEKSDPATDTRKFSKRRGKVATPV